MPITAQDIKLLASARMTDAADSGGPMTGQAVQDGVENNVFPDISNTDRAFGRLQLRKVYGAVLPTTGTDALLGANAIIHAISADPDVVEWATPSTGPTDDRAQVVQRLEVSHWEPLGPGDGSMVWVDSDTLTSPAFAPLPGMVVYAQQAGGGYGSPVLLTSVTLDTGNNYTVAYHGTWQAGGGMGARLGVPSTVAPRLAACKPISGSLSVGATHADVDSVLVRVVPKQAGALPGAAAQTGIDGVPVVPDGVAVGFRSGDGLVVHHTAVVAAATYTAGATVDCGRTDLAMVRVVGADGVGISTGWTVNLATGIVSISSVTGWAQPVTVHHTIEEVLACSRIGYPEVQGGASQGGGGTLAAGPFALTLDLTMYCGRTAVGSIRVISKTGQDITDLTYMELVSGTPTAMRYFYPDLAAGTVDTPNATVAGWSGVVSSHSPVTLVSSGTYTAPSTPTAPQTTLHRVTFNRALTRAFPAGSYLSSMLFMGDLQAQAGASFSQQTWTDVWADARIGDPIVAQYNQAGNPIAVTDLGAVTERWAIIFTSSTAYRLVGESVGQIATGNTASNLVPINPATGAAYFTLLATGWGSGWSAGNVLRFNTRGANAPFWVARAVLPSPPNATPDSLLVTMRGDIDT